MDGSLDTVVHFKVQLWELVFLVRRSLLDITKGRRINNVAHNETGDSLVLWDGLSSRDASVVGGWGGLVILVQQTIPTLSVSQQP